MSLSEVLETFDQTDKVMYLRHFAFLVESEVLSGPARCVEDGVPSMIHNRLDHLPPAVLRASFKCWIPKWFLAIAFDWLPTILRPIRYRGRSVVQLGPQPAAAA